jgi:hypothetical protein
LLLPL